jgi:hypothetical protein
MMSATEIISVINSLLLPKNEADSPRTVFNSEGTLIKSQSMLIRLCEHNTADLSCLYLLFEFLAHFVLSKCSKEASLTKSFLDPYILDQERIKHYLEDPSFLENIYLVSDAICLLIHQTVSQLRSLSESDNWQESELIGNLIVDAVPSLEMQEDPIISNLRFLQRDRTIKPKSNPLFKRPQNSEPEQMIKKQDLLLTSLRIHLITWNVQGYVPNSERNIEGLFEPTKRLKPDIVIIGINSITQLFRKYLNSKARIWEEF